MSDDTRTQLEEERREEVERAVHRALKPLVGRTDWAEDDTAIGAQASRIADTAIELSALPLRNAQVAAVLALHAPSEYGCISECRESNGDLNYPCPTIRAIDEAGA